MTVSASYIRPDGRVESVLCRSFKAAAPAHNDNEQFMDGQIGPAYVNHLVKSAGGTDTLRVIYWENPKKPHEYIVGFIQEAWERGRLRKGWPAVRLYAYATHHDRDVACKHRNTLAQSHTFSDILKNFVPGAKLVSTNSRDLPFKPLVYWRDETNRALVPVSN